MIDARLDLKLMDLNKRYQEIIRSELYLSNINRKRYTDNLKHLEIRRLIADLKYRKYAKDNFSTKGNSIKSTIEMQDVSGMKIAVYSCVIGHYDQFIDPVYCENEVDYIMFTDQELPDGTAWKKIDISDWEDYGSLSPIMMNRKLKILQNELLLGYDYTIYVDGNVEIVAGVSPIISQMKNHGFGVHYHRSRDCIIDEMVSVKHIKGISGELMDKQLSIYRADGYPRHYGMFENSILVRDNRDSSALALMNEWWNEYNRFPTRDQLSLPYIIWKTGFDLNRILIIGNDVEMNPRFNRINLHLK